jgi:predicted SnoaL-like aldol condensation-catalyzing enzyme
MHSTAELITEMQVVAVHKIMVMALQYLFELFTHPECMDNKQIAVAFLEQVVKGNIAYAYEHYVHPSMRHHNAYHPGDRKSLQEGMEENHKEFPHKKITIKHIIAEGNFVVAHSHLQLGADKELAVVHWMRFEDKKIIELWDIGQLIPADAPNNMF